MIKGALIFAAGFSCGYIKALAEMDELRDLTVELKEYLRQTAKEGSTPSTTAEEIIIDSDAEPETPTEGETP